MTGTVATLRWLRARVVPYVVMAALLTAVLVPLGWVGSRDSFPLSSYPMFSHTRDRQSPVATVVGIDERGRRVILDPWLIAGSDEVILASATVWRAVRRGQPSSNRLCAEVATRVATDPGRPGASLTRLEVVVEYFDTIAYFNGEREPLERRVSADCTVPYGDRRST